jgi:hypothetical protein
VLREAHFGGAAWLFLLGHEGRGNRFSACGGRALVTVNQTPWVGRFSRFDSDPDLFVVNSTMNGEKKSMSIRMALATASLLASLLSSPTLVDASPPAPVYLLQWQAKQCIRGTCRMVIMRLYSTNPRGDCPRGYYCRWQRVR